MLSFMLTFRGAKAEATKKYKSAINYSTDWRNISGPGLDPSCRGTCSTGLLIQTIECGVSGGQPITTGLMSLRDANSMLCSNRSIDSADESIVERNADNIAACFRKNPNKDQYEVFIHEMLCQWKICKNNPPAFRTLAEKLGVWRLEDNGGIQMTLYNKGRPGSLPIQYSGRASEFGAELMSHNLSLCDVVRDTAGASGSQATAAPIVLPGTVRESIPAARTQQRSRSQQASH